MLKLAHHGSATSTRPELLAAVRPTLALVSASCRRAGLPAGAVLYVRVVQEDGTPLTWWHALLRFMLAIPSLLLGGLGFLWMLVDKDRLTWHDRGSGTKVIAEIPVKARKPNRNP